MKPGRLTFLIATAIAAAIAFTGFAAQNPVPLVNQPLVPDAAAPGGTGFTLTVNGTGFVSGSVVHWNGSPRATAFVSESRLTASIQASDIAKTGTASVTVVSPGPGGGTSNVAFLGITEPTSSVRLVTASYATADRSYAVAVGDFNGDGTFDLAVAGYITNTISVLLGNGDGTFQAHVDYATGSDRPQGVAVADFNGDGKLDLAVTHQYDTITVLLGNGDGTFQPAVNVGAFAVGAVGDFNRDGKLDLAVGDGNNTLVLFGNGDGTFQPAVNVGAGWPGAVGDYNRDGKLDLVALNGNAITVLLGDGDGTFQPGVSYSTGPGITSMAVADFNADGKLDLVMSNNVTDNVSILLGNGDGTFQTHVDYGTGSSNPLSVNVGDFNGDGRPDLVVADLFGTVHLLLGKGDGTFGAAASYAAGLDPSSVALGDFNGDGRLDIAAADSSTATVSVLLQPTVLLSKPGLTFAGQDIHTSSAPQSVTLTNVGPIALSPSIAITGADAHDFSQTNTCGSSVPPQGGSCTITVTFTPTLTGPRNASVTITDNVVGSPQHIALSGTGTVSGPNATLSPSSLIFATQLVRTTSPVQSVTLGDYGTVALTINSINLTGADPAEFQTNTTCGSSVAPGATCTINVTFTPTRRGSRAATLSIADNAPGSPQTLSLSGTATVVELNPGSLFFGVVEVTQNKILSTTLTNTGTGTLSITGSTLTGSDSDEFSLVNTCGSSVGAGQSCTISVRFEPTETGADSAALSISDNGGGSPQQVSLSGSGIVVPPPKPLCRCGHGPCTAVCRNHCGCYYP
jgi:hypothetical protein